MTTSINIPSTSTPNLGRRHIAAAAAAIAVTAAAFATTIDFSFDAEPLSGLPTTAISSVAPEALHPAEATFLADNRPAAIRQIEALHPAEAAFLSGDPITSTVVIEQMHPAEAAFVAGILLKNTGQPAVCDAFPC